MDTERNFKNTNKKDLTDLNNKMLIVFNVLQTCIKEKDEIRNNTTTTLDRLISLTNLPKDVLCKVWDSTNIPEPTDILSYKMFENPEIDFAVRHGLITQYLKYNKIPTMKSLQIIFPNDSPHQIRLHLKRSGYIWKQLPYTKRAIIVERPERVIQRQRYLQQMDCYRKQKRCIVYVEEKIINKSLPGYKYFEEYLNNAENTYVVFVAVATKNKYLDGTILAGSSLLKCQELIEENFIKNILPRLPTQSVIVLEDKLYLCKSLAIPTIESDKSSMINWLNINNIPHDEGSHRGELLALIENCKIKGDLHKFDAIVQARGHEIIRRPQKTNYLNYFKPLWNSILNSAETKYTHTMITDKSPRYWLYLEDSLLSFERIVYKEDLDMENVIDKILTMAKYQKNTVYSRWVDAECDEEKDTLKHEEFLIPCSNFL